jgi:hypothetical protein
MEGIDQNPVYYELVLDSLWQKPGGRPVSHSVIQSVIQTFRQNQSAT